MKFGKTFQETLSGPGIPAEWRQTAIEYRKLKKVINRVASELADLGLTSDVLKDLLTTDSETPLSTPERATPLSTPERATLTEMPGPGDAGPSRLASGGVDGKEGAELSPKASGETVPPLHHVGREIDWDSEEDEVDEALRSAKAKGKRRKTRRRATAKYELGGTTEQPEPGIRLVLESDSSADTLSSPSDSDHRLFPLPSSDTNSVLDARFTEVNSSEEDPTKDTDDDSNSSEASPPSTTEFAGVGPKENALLKRVYGLGARSDDEEDWASMNVDVEAKTRRRKSDATVRWDNLDEAEQKDLVVRAEEEGQKAPEVGREAERDATASPVDSVSDAGRADDADDEGSAIPQKKPLHHPHRHRKEIFIPLSSETEFLTLLAKALSSLAELQITQKQHFAQAVQLLAREVSHVSSPSRPKSDLYVWREIFSLWVEAQIFESDREKDRGERTVEDAEAKLDWFVDQIAKRKLGKKMKHKESRVALDKFIGLNVQLLDMKRFQLANEEAARKILKKHDKRTALTASLGFPSFIAAASTLSSLPPLQADGSRSGSSRVLILPGFPSLPHMLLTTFTTTLLPIIPQLEDYECAICGDVAFKPIKLDCGHRFCVRCLITMQKRGQDACPHCRQPVVLGASARNLDHAMQEYLNLWFPKEVKEKDKLNRTLQAKEELEAMGLSDHKCIVQ